MTSTGFSPASVGVMAAVYAVVVPLLKVPSGGLADRCCRAALAQWRIVVRLAGPLSAEDVAVSTR